MTHDHRTTLAELQPTDGRRVSLLDIDTAVTRGIELPRPSARVVRARLVRALRGVRAWMLVLPVDGLMLLAPAAWAPHLWWPMAATSLVGLLMLTGGGRYRAMLHLSAMDDLPGTLRSGLTAVAMVAIGVALTHDDGVLTDYLVKAAAALGLVVLGRFATFGVINVSRRRHITRHRTILVGSGQVAGELAATLAEHPRYGLTVVGLVESGPAVARLDLSVPYRGQLAELGEVVERSGADVVLIADGDLDEAQVMEAVEGPSGEGVDVLVVPRMHYLRTGTTRSDHIGSIPVMRLSHANLDGPGLLVKRAFDVVVAGVLLVAVAPLVGVAAVLIKLTDGGGVIFRQPRIGRDGVVFDCLKLRSMTTAPATQTSTSWSVTGDARMTPIGRLMRRTSIDELPQLWNVLRGDMSLVGPRPERPHFVEMFMSQYDVYGRRHRVRVGLTGLAQVNGLRGDTSIAERARFDNYYIENWSLWMDLKVMLQTVSEVVFAKGR